MVKTKLTVSVDLGLFNYIDAIARKYFSKNRSAAAEWIVKASMKQGIFEKFMARHHAAQLAQYHERLKDLEQEHIKVEI